MYYSIQKLILVKKTISLFCLAGWSRWSKRPCSTHDMEDSRCSSSIWWSKGRDRVLSWWTKYKWVGAVDASIYPENSWSYRNAYRCPSSWHGDQCTGRPNIAFGIVCDPLSFVCSATFFILLQLWNRPWHGCWTSTRNFMVTHQQSSQASQLYVKKCGSKLLWCK